MSERSRGIRISLLSVKAWHRLEHKEKCPKVAGFGQHVSVFQSYFSPGPVSRKWTIRVTPVTEDISHLVFVIC